MTKKVLSFDAETDGLWGRAFAIGAIVLDQHGAEITRFLGRLPDTCVSDSWVKENVLPTLKSTPVTHPDYESLLKTFAEFYLAHKKDAEVVTHMGYIVEAHLFREMHERGLIGDWDAPYPLLDVSGNLQQAGEDPTSVDKYAEKFGITVDRLEGGTHNPLYDSLVTAQVYRHLTKRS